MQVRISIIDLMGLRIGELCTETENALLSLCIGTEGIPVIILGTRQRSRLVKITERYIIGGKFIAAGEIEIMILNMPGLEISTLPVSIDILDKLRTVGVIAR